MGPENKENKTPATNPEVSSTNKNQEHNQITVYYANVDNSLLSKTEELNELVAEFHEETHLGWNLVPNLRIIMYKLKQITISC